MQLAGNHSSRVLKQTLIRFPEIISIVADFWDEYYDFEGVEVFKSERDYVEIDNTIFCHGWLSNAQSHRAYFKKNVVIGHIHKPTIHYAQNYKTDYRPEWAMSCGSFIDQNKIPAQYTASKFTQDRPSIGIVENGFPRLELL